MTDKKDTKIRAIHKGITIPTDEEEVIHFLKEDVVRGGLTAHLVSAFDEESDTW